MRADDLASFIDEADNQAPVLFFVNGTKISDNNITIQRHKDYGGDSWIDVKIKMTEQPLDD